MSCARDRAPSGAAPPHPIDVRLPGGRTAVRSRAALVTATTPGLVCAHHHLYSTLARGMPPPPATPITFTEILERIWWRVDAALDLELVRWSALLGAVEALEAGTTALVDHPASPSALDRRLDVIAAACAEVGVRVLC